MDDSSTDTEVVMERSPKGRRGDALIPPMPRKNNDITIQEWKANIKECLQHGYVWCNTESKARRMSNDDIPIVVSICSACSMALTSWDRAVSVPL
jgi:hypothetical protein